MTSSRQKLEIAGTTVTIRPIRRTDVKIEQDFVRRLSPKSKHYRFLRAIRELSDKEVEQFCDVDGHRSMAFVATIEEQGRTRQIGVSRYAPATDGDAREIAVTVADDWQHRGLGTRLAEVLIQHAREHGVSKLYSIILVDNMPMRTLAHDLGMSAAPDPDDVHQVIYSLDLVSLPGGTPGKAQP